ncbi:MAG: RNA methyltransferase, partial [Lachnospiraceae bacterium]|nr:RNA methyltransferase [Lachnospiraceae bacterium]
MIKEDYIKIENLDLPELEVYRQNNEVKLLRANEPEPGIFICESAKVIKRALDAGYEPLSILASEAIDEESRNILNGIKDVPVYMGDDSVLRELA